MKPFALPVANDYDKPEKSYRTVVFHPSEIREVSPFIVEESGFMSDPKTCAARTMIITKSYAKYSHLPFEQVVEMWREAMSDEVVHYKLGDAEVTQPADHEARVQELTALILQTQKLIPRTFANTELHAKIDALAKGAGSEAEK